MGVAAVLCWFNTLTLQELERAHAREDVGAKVSEIQARLGHSNPATTGLYLTALSAAENLYADTLTATWGSRPPACEGG